MLNKKNICIISLELLALVFLAVFAVVTFNNYRVKAISFADEEISSDTQNIKYDFDYIAVKEAGSRRRIEIKGWIVEEGVEPEAKDKISVVLKNTKTQQYYSIPTARQYNKNATNYFYDGISYDDSGFEAKTLSTSEVDPYEYDYEIYFLFKNASGRRLICTGQKLENVNAYDEESK